MAQDDAAWLAKSPALREKLIAVGLVEPEPIPEKVIIPTLDAFLDGYIQRHGKSRKPATVAVWKQVVANLKEYMPEGIRINQITAGHAKEFHEKLKARGMATTTIHKRIQFARQFMHDAVDKLMKKANSVWQVILGRSRYPVFLNHRTHRTHRNESSPRHVIFPCVRCVPWFPALMGWKNSNLRTEMTRLLRRAGVSGWPRLFHSMRASRQTELQREFPLHVVCSWLGNSPRIAQQSYLLVTEDDFAKAAGVAKVMVEG
jgi:hypothetical protein